MSFLDKVKNMVNVSEEEYYDDLDSGDYSSKDRDDDDDVPAPRSSRSFSRDRDRDRNDPNKVVNINTTAQLQVVLAKPESFEEAKAIIDMYETEDILRCFTDRSIEDVLHEYVGIERRDFAYKPVRKMRVGQDAIAIKLYVTKSETQPEVETEDGVAAKKIQNIYVYCQYITRVS